MVSDTTLIAWKKWSELATFRCHLHLRIKNTSVERHIENCFSSSRMTVTRLMKDIPQNFNPKRILEIGASVGFNSLALAKHFKESEVHSIEPDVEAVEVAIAMAQDYSLNYSPTNGLGEKLDYPDKYFDLIVCHTVIEHVNNVPKVISEMARVLSEKGIIHLEAPNYIWPYEPHLEVWCVPLLGKPLLRAMSWLQGKKEDNWYVNHLQFVTPFKLEREFLNNNLSWENLVAKKLEECIDGRAEIKKYHTASRLIKLSNKVGLNRFIIPLIVRFGLYPSVIYSLRRMAVDA